MFRATTFREGSTLLSTPDLPFAKPAGFLVRAVPGSFAFALRQKRDESEPLSVPLAREQHAAYVQALRETGAPVTLLPADEACPDCCFIEDTAVVLGRRALVTRPGAPSRMKEVGPVRAVLDRTRDTFAMDAPATLDGGDVLRIGGTLFVGLSSRTNYVGMAWAAEVAQLEGLTLVTVTGLGGLHLKSVCSLAKPGLVVYLRAGCDPKPFEQAGLECMPVPEPEGANVLALGSTVLVSADAPRTAELLASRGLTVKTVRVSEFHRADGALTCLSLRLPPAGGWVT